MCGSESIAASAEEMEAGLVDVVADVFAGYFDPLLVEDTLVAANEAEHFAVVAQQAQNDVVSAGCLSAVETDSDTNLAGL